MSSKAPSQVEPQPLASGKDDPFALDKPTAFAPGLYVVATPIGNARDITLRALDLLRSADVIACEDTRVTAKLLAIHDIRATTMAYHDHNAERQRPKLIERMKNGAIVAQVTDAGTPLVSDPGLKLVQAALAENIAVTALPGPSSVLTALMLAALPSDRFFFQGFLPNKKSQRAKVLEEIKAVPATLVFLESAKRLAASLADMGRVLGDRPGAVMREMTKKFEEARRLPLSELAAHYEVAGPPKGEVVVVVGPPTGAERTLSDQDLDQLIVTALETMSVRDAAAEVAEKTAAKKKDVYARALVLANLREAIDEG